MRNKIEASLPQNRPPRQIKAVRNPANELKIHVYQDTQEELFVFAEFWPMKANPKKQGKLVQSWGTMWIDDEHFLDPVWKREFNDEWTKSMHGVYVVRAYVMVHLFNCDLREAYDNLAYIIDSLNKRRTARNKEIQARNDKRRASKKNKRTICANLLSLGDPYVALKPLLPMTVFPYVAVLEPRHLRERIDYLNKELKVPPGVTDVDKAVVECRLCGLPDQSLGTVFTHCTYCHQSFCKWCVQGNRYEGRWFLACDNCYRVLPHQDFTRLEDK